MTSLVALLTGIAVGAVGTWFYDRGVTIPGLKRKATEETNTPLETTSPDAAQRRWQMPPMPTFGRKAAAPAETSAGITPNV